MLPALAAIVQPLLANGLGLVANAVMAKGQAWVEGKTGVKLQPNMPPKKSPNFRWRRWSMKKS